MNAVYDRRKEALVSKTRTIIHSAIFETEHRLVTGRHMLSMMYYRL